MNKKFLQSLAVGIVGLTLATSCSALHKHHDGCAKSGCAKKTEAAKVEATKADAPKAEKKHKKHKKAVVATEAAKTEEKKK